MGKSAFLMEKKTINGKINYFYDHPQNLVAGCEPTPLKNDGVSKSVGMMTFPTEWKVIKFHSSKPPISFGMFLYTWFLNE